MEPRSEDRGDQATEPPGLRGRDVAAMEPRSEDRGDVGQREALVLEDEIAAMEPRSEDRGDDSLTPRPLATSPTPQWSRGPRTAVTPGGPGGGDQRRGAAMEPRSEDRGDSPRPRG